MTIALRVDFSKCWRQGAPEGELRTISNCERSIVNLSKQQDPKGFYPAYTSGDSLTIREFSGTGIDALNITNQFFGATHKITFASVPPQQIGPTFAEIIFADFGADKQNGPAPTQGVVITVEPPSP